MGHYQKNPNFDPYSEKLEVTYAGAFFNNVHTANGKVQVHIFWHGKTCNCRVDKINQKYFLIKYYAGKVSYRKYIFIENLE